MSGLQTAVSRCNLHSAITRSERKLNGGLDVVLLVTDITAELRCLVDRVERPDVQRSRLRSSKSEAVTSRASVSSRPFSAFLCGNGRSLRCTPSKVVTGWTSQSVARLSGLIGCFPGSKWDCLT